MRSGEYGFEGKSRVPVVRHPSEIDDDDDPPRPERAALVMVRRLVGVLLADSNRNLGVECLALITGIGYDGSSMADIARRHGVTRAAVSKRCVDLCDDFGIPPVRAMRPAKNRDACRVARFKEMSAP